MCASSSAVVLTNLAPGDSGGCGGSGGGGDDGGGMGGNGGLGGGGVGGGVGGGGKTIPHVLHALRHRDMYTLVPSWVSRLP